MNEYEGKIFFFLYYFMHEKLEYGGNFSHLLHEKLKLCWKEFPQKLSKNDRLLGSQEFIFIKITYDNRLIS